MQAMTDESSRKIFVGGLPWQADENILRTFFSAFGPVETARLIMDKGTGNSKGYGFVVYADQASAFRAVMNPYPVIEGKKCNCNLASLGAKANDPYNQMGRGDRGQKRNFNQANWSAAAGTTTIKKPKMEDGEHQSYVSQLRQQGQIVTPESVMAQLEELSQDPCEAYKYFIERSEVFDTTSPQYLSLASDLLASARTVRVQQALSEGITTGLVQTAGAAKRETA